MCSINEIKFSSVSKNCLDVVRNENEFVDDWHVSDPLLPTVNVNKINKRHERKCSVCFPIRFNLIFWTFMGIFICYALRANLSVAIIAMTKSDGDNDNATSINSSCYSINYSNISSNVTEKTGEFDWNEKTQGVILSSFFYGYMLTAVIGGLLAEKYGGKWVFGCGMFITSIATVLTPVAARLHVVALICARLIAGLGEGVTFPAFYTIYSYWIPRQERSVSLAFTNSGAHVGTLVAMPATAWLCDKGFDGGWPSAFYISGCIGCIWFGFWSCCVVDKPESSSCICDDELVHILKNRHSEKKSLKFKSVPWKKILTSFPVYALALSKFSGLWTYYTMLTELPTYMHLVLNYPIEENGALNSAVFTAIAITTIIAGISSDAIRSKNWISITALRKIYQSLAMFGAASLLLAITFVGCDTQAVIFILIATMALTGFTAGGEAPVALDMSPEYVGIVYGFSNSLGNIAGVLAPTVTGLITQGNDPLKSWNRVFYLASIINTIGGIAFLFFGSATKQPWSSMPST